MAGLPPSLRDDFARARTRLANASPLDRAAFVSHGVEPLLLVGGAIVGLLVLAEVLD